MNNRRCFVTIDKKAFESNLMNLQKFLNGRSKIIGIVKADFYGHGVDELIKIYIQHGVVDFAVATLDEALALRKQYSDISILVLGYIEKKDWMIAHNNNIIMSIVDEVHASKLNEYALMKKICLQVEVKVDTGMNRIGIAPSCDDQILKLIYQNENLKVNGTYSHLCCADSFEEKDKEFTHHQFSVYKAFLKRLSNLGYNYGRTHIQASSGICNYPEEQFDFVRPGFVILGYQLGDVQERFERKPVLSWKTHVEMIKKIEPGQGVSYGQTFKAEKPMRIATLTVGYGDGYPRCLSNKGYVMINMQKANIVGRICMDQMMVDVTNIPCKSEDEVTLIGEGITISELSEMANTIADEIACNINKRVEREFI